jgi:hypothetical protein
MAKQTDPLTDLLEFPLFEALMGRRARRFGLGMQIPSGPLAFRSRKPPQPLSELERSVLIAAGTGVTGWSFGVPFGPDRPTEHAHYTQRFTGRTGPTAGGFGTPVLMFTDDEGTYVTNTRDNQPTKVSELDGDHPTAAAQIVAVCRKHTTQLSSSRLDLPGAGMVVPEAQEADDSQRRVSPRAISAHRDAPDAPHRRRDAIARGPPRLRQFARCVRPIADRVSRHAAQGTLHSKLPASLESPCPL